ncbi:MFS transporter [Streptomyces griseorubiginosus]|uniref:MFS transporter n=1 Tax=Streptomyces griseorubiginosus TaxID=67304 RepID=UPI003404BD6D
MTTRTGFGLFLTARVVSWAGSTVTAVALPVLLYQRTGSASLSGLLTALEALPYLVLGLPAGALADRWDRRRTLTWCSWSSAALIAAIPAAAALGLLSTVQLMLTGPAVSAVFVFFDAAAFGALATLVGHDGLARATGRMMSASTLIGLIGPSAAGLLVATLAPPTAITLDALSYAAAALLLSRLPLTPIAHVKARSPVRGTLADIAEGLQYIRRHPLIRPLTLLGIGNSFTEGAVVGLIVVTAVRTFGMDPDDGRIGLFWAAAALGALAAATALPRLQKRAPLGWITLGGLAANAAFLACWAASPGLVTGLASLACWQSANALVSLNGIVIRQQLTPGPLQGRINTTARMIAWGGQPLGAAASGLLADAVGVRTALLTAALGALLSLSAGLTTPLRRRAVEVGTSGSALGSEAGKAA